MFTKEFIEWDITHGVIFQVIFIISISDILKHIGFVLPLNIIINSIYHRVQVRKPHAPLFLFINTTLFNKNNSTEFNASQTRLQINRK